MSADGTGSGSMPYLDAAAAPSLVGQVIDGRYKIFKKLGEGGMGEVYAAEHVHIDKKFAIKLLKTEIVSNAEAVTRFQQEARSSSSIKHRNIIAIEDFGKLSDGRIYMCMELLDGQALNDLIQSPQTIERLLNILIQTGHGLAAAHARNIVHRDMKPENIFVTFHPNNEDIPKILDFGIAKVAGNEGQNNLTRTGTIFGTPFYMAPEQALGNPVDARTDIYAMGVIMYEVFAGSLPFQGESFMGILTQHITTDPEHVAQRAAKANRPLPPGLAEIIMACLQKNPAQRFGTMDELVNQLIGVYRRVAGAGMSTYMEAFPQGASAMHPVQTPGPMSAPHGFGSPVSATIGVGAPPGVMPSGGHAYVPVSGSAPAMVPQSGSSSGLYSPSQSNVAPKKGNTGLIIAILAVLAVGGGVAAFVILGQKEGKAGDGSGSQVASGDGSGTNTKVGNDVPDAGVAATTPDAKQVAVAGTPDAAVAASTPDAGEATVAPDAAVQVAAIDAGSEPPPKEIDAGVLAPKVTQVSLVGMNVSSYEAYVDGAVVPLVGGDHVIDVPEGKKVKVTIKAKGFKDKDVVLDGKSRIAKFSASKIPVVTNNGNTGSNGNNTTNNNGSNTPPPATKCTGTSADLSAKLGPTCAVKFCREHTDAKSQSACDVYNN
jgi:serine/threonine protein kinase